MDSADDHGELQGSKVTNVVKLFANLAGRVTPQTMTMRDEQEKLLPDAAGGTVQIAKYMHGVGDSDSFLKKAMGGMFGMGVIARIVRGYTFISRYYDPGDEIHIAGFSRGAYTARALAGMISSVGLLNRTKYDASDKNEAYRLGIGAWCKCKNVSLHGAGRLTDMATNMLNFVGGFFARQLLDADQLIANVPIKSVAVWDTVGSMGIPAYAADKRFDVFRFVDTRLSDKVQNGFHAMALDELRADFPVTAWEARAGIKQVWFVGAHADVGGGYSFAESRLSDIGLGWMMKQLAEVGVRLATPLTYAPEPLIDPEIHKPWTKAPFALLPRSPRQVASKDTIHESVLRRWEADGRYRPEALNAVAAKLSQLQRESG
jgi:glutathione S-transferase